MLDFAKYGVLDNNLKCVVEIKHGEIKETYGTYLTGDWSAEYGKKSVSVDLLDETDAWNDVEVEISKLNHPNNDSFLVLLKYFLSKVNCVDYQIESLLNSVIYSDYEFKKGNIIEQLKKLFELQQLVLYKEPSGRFVIRRFIAMKT